MRDTMQDPIVRYTCDWCKKVDYVRNLKDVYKKTSPETWVHNNGEGPGEDFCSSGCRSQSEVAWEQGIDAALNAQTDKWETIRIASALERRAFK